MAEPTTHPLRPRGRPTKRTPKISASDRLVQSSKHALASYKPSSEDSVYYAMDLTFLCFPRQITWQLVTNSGRMVLLYVPGIVGCFLFFIIIIINFLFLQFHKQFHIYQRSTNMYKENDYVPNSTILDGFYFIKGSLLNYCLIIVFFSVSETTPMHRASLLTGCSHVCCACL